MSNTTDNCDELFPCSNFPPNFTFHEFFWNSSISTFGNCFLLSYSLTTSLFLFSTCIGVIFSWCFGGNGISRTIISKGYYRCLTIRFIVANTTTATLLAAVILAIVSHDLHSGYHNEQNLVNYSNDDILQLYLTPAKPPFNIFVIIKEVVGIAAWTAYIISFVPLLRSSVTQSAYHISGLLRALCAIAWLFVSVSYGLLLYNTISKSYNELEYVFAFSTMMGMQNVLTLARFALQCIIGSAYLVEYCCLTDIETQALRHSWDRGDRTRLLTDESVLDHDSGEETRTDTVVLVSPDKANRLNKLTFWWTNKLMLKGYRGQLNGIRDLFPLPRAIDSRTLINAYQRRKLLMEGSTEYADVSTLLTPNSSQRGSLDRRVLIEANDNGPGRNTEVDGESQTRTRGARASGHNQIRAWRVLQHTALGRAFYCIGLLKLVCDLCAFAGPVILHELVSFMEQNATQPDCSSVPKMHNAQTIIFPAQLDEFGTNQSFLSVDTEHSSITSCDPHIKNYMGWVYAGGMFAAAAVNALSSVHFGFFLGSIKLKLRASVIGLVYSQLLDISSAEAGRLVSGRIINAMSVDADSILNFCDSFHALWSIPLQIALAFFLLYQQVQAAFLAGVAVALILIPINRAITRGIVSATQRLMTAKDSRVRLLTELLTGGSGIRTIRCSALEPAFAKRVGQYRAEELSALATRKYLDALCVYLWAAAPVVIALSTFTTYTAMGYELNAAKVFTSIALFNMLITPLNVLPWAINGILEAWVSARRVQEFLDLRPMDLDKYFDPEPCIVDKQAAYCFHGTDFAWSREGHRAEVGLNVPRSSLPSATLPRLDLTLPLGSLIGVTGSVGSGKSSLLAACLGEMYKRRGHLCSWSHIAEYPVSVFTQEPWLESKTVRENITFGFPFNSNRYYNVVDVCCLSEDLKLMPNGDFTEIGEQGVTLSGGQRARISLARALYLDTEVYLLDDPLSAVDPRVANAIFHRAIRKFLANKTVILITHRTAYLRHVDRLLLMSAGKIEAYGQPEEVFPLIQGHSTEADTVNESEDKEMEKKHSEAGEAKEPTEEEECEDERPVEYDLTGLGETVPVLIQSEEAEVGTVRLSVYMVYVRAVGWCLFAAIIISLAAMQTSRNLTDWWLSYWVSHAANNASGTDYSRNMANISNYDRLTGPYNYGTTIPYATPGETMFGFSLHKHYLVLSENAYPYALLVFEQTLCDSLSQSKTAVISAISGWRFYLLVYGLIAAANTLLTFIRAFLFAFGGIRAAKRIHVALLEAILAAPMRFFETTPVGRIVNRFSSDLYTVDDSLPFQANILAASMFGIIGTTVMTCYGLPWFALILPVVALIYFGIQKCYRFTTCDLKRLSSVSLSPLYCLFNDTISGVVPIRAFKVSERFYNELHDLLTDNQRAQFSVLACSSWFAARLQFLGVLMVTTVALIAVIQHYYSTVDPGLVGLALSYALAITGLLSAGVTSFTETEKELVSLERINHYASQTPTEEAELNPMDPPHGSPHGSPSLPAIRPRQDSANFVIFAQPPSDWPQHGSVVFKEVSLRYAPNSPFALREVSFRSSVGERIGIVGRTGSGKSSILRALFRLSPLASGSILVDGLDIASVPLATLRSHLAIVPQVSSLFSGTFRDNVDLFADAEDSTGDSRMWDIIHKLQLQGLMVRLGGGLDAMIEDGGKNLSVGEKQLICLARVMYQDAKIICIDEATAHVDSATDALIQKNLRSSFPEATLLIIAHRLSTVLDCDKILVMEAGRLVETGNPRALLTNKASRFAQMMAATTAHRNGPPPPNIPPTFKTL